MDRITDRHWGRRTAGENVRVGLHVAAVQGRNGSGRVGIRIQQRLDVRGWQRERNFVAVRVDGWFVVAEELEVPRRFGRPRGGLRGRVFSAVQKRNLGVETMLKRLGQLFSNGGLQTF